MSHTKGIIIRLKTVRKARNAAHLPQRMKSFPASGENLVAVCLMSHIPNQLIFGKVKDTVQRKSQFHCSQTRRQMPAVFGHGFHNKGPQFLSQPFQFAYTVSF